MKLAKHLIAFVMLAGSASAAPEANDPAEPINRGVDSFNRNVVDRFVVTPLAKFHNRALPRPARVSIHHFLANLDEPKTFENALLQGQFGYAGQSLGRFAINTTLGIAGLLDVADTFGIPAHDEDFGQTLGSYGVGSGPYIVLPVLGPSNLRDVTGKIVDTLIDPLGFIPLRSSTYWTIGRKGVTTVDEHAHDLRDNLSRPAPADPYLDAREHYAVEREAEISNRRVEVALATTPKAAPANAVGERGFEVVGQQTTGTELVFLLHASGTQILSCDDLWHRLDVTSPPPGIQTVTVATAPPGPQLRCTKLIDRPQTVSPPTSEPSPASAAPPSQQPAPPGPKPQQRPNLHPPGT